MLNQIKAASLLALLAVPAFTFAGPALLPTSKPSDNGYAAAQDTAKAALAEYQKLIPKPEGLADANAAHRDAVAGQAIPLVKSILVNLDKMTEAKPANKRPILAVRLNQEGMLYALGDADTLRSLEEKVKAGGPEGLMALNVQLRGKWYRAGQDTARQTEVLREIDAVAAANPTDIWLSQFIADARSSTKTTDVRKHLADTMANTMNNPTSKALRAQMTAEDKTLAVEGKPLVLAGKTVDGKDFTTADWQGKVILVDFWAVWCAPCVAELPRIKKVYEQYHAQGFEVLGVSNDEMAETVTKFAAKRELPWPQLHDEAAGEKGIWHPLTKQFGINGIPVMFLIDKKGVCRTVSAREDFETLIPKLLAE